MVSGAAERAALQALLYGCSVTTCFSFFDAADFVTAEVPLRRVVDRVIGDVVGVAVLSWRCIVLSFSTS